MQLLLSTYDDTVIMFADYVNKVNGVGKSQKRGIVVTNKNIYKVQQEFLLFADLSSTIQRTTKLRNLALHSSKLRASGNALKWVRWLEFQLQHQARHILRGSL